MLAIKNVLARADRVPTLIFDEIDQGIGGRVGSVVGQKLWQLSQNHQVLCVTHLPQLAAFGEQHLQVQKTFEEGRTITQVTSLKKEARIDELALMMGTVSESTRQSATELLQSALKVTQSNRLE
jgi:DNA repair protein RecN (Recombination protein N)